LNDHQSALHAPPGSAAPPNTKPQVFSLRELAQHLAPLTLRYWLRADDYLSAWHTSAQKDLEELEASLKKRPYDGLSIPATVVWRPGMPIRLHEGDNPIEDKLDVLDRRAHMERRRAALHRRLMDKIRAVLTSPDCVIKGIGPAGTQVLVPREVVPQLEIDLKRQVLCTNGGQWSRWEAPFVVWRPDERPKRADRKNDQRMVLATLKELYGDDLPTGKGSKGPESIARMQRRLEREKGLARSEEVIQRALSRKD
jgi:hypothetical protein